MSGAASKPKITRTQLCYLDAADGQRLQCGWGGLRSTLTVRLLEERGLVTVSWNPVGHWPRWTITSVLPAGRDALSAWRDQR